MQKLEIKEHSYLTETILKLLIQNRIITLLDFLQEDPVKISVLTRLTLPQVLEIRNSILAKYSAPLINGASLFIKKLTCKEIIRTGIESLDETLNGGIPVGFITEICGLAGSGKSQLCMQLAINCAKNTNTVLYIDTKGDFSAVRIQKILEECGCSHKDMALVMLKIKIVHIWSMEDLIKLFDDLKCGILNIAHLSLIIIDSLPSLMFQHFGDDNKIGLKLLNNFVNYGRYICNQFEIGLVCVNIQTRWVDQDIIDPEEDAESTSTTKDATYTEKLNRCLGQYWKNIPILILMLEKLNDPNKNNCSVKVTMTDYNNPQIIKTCVLEITSSGIT